MKTLQLTALALLICLQSQLKADPEKLHWYEVTILVGDSTRTFTGSSEFDPGMFIGNAKTQVVKLENLRVEGAKPGEDKVRWHPYPANKKALHIMPGAILFIHELSGDPMTGQQ